MNDPIVLYDGNRVLMLLRPGQDAAVLACPLENLYAPAGMAPRCPICGMAPLLLRRKCSGFIETKCVDGHESWIFSRRLFVIR